MNEQDEIISVAPNNKLATRDGSESDSDSDMGISNNSPTIKPKKKVRFEKVDEIDMQRSKKRKCLDEDNARYENKHKKSKLDNGHEHNPEEEQDHTDESHPNDTIDWPQNDLRTLVKNMEQALPEKDILAFQTRADKLNWDDIAFDKYTGEDCKKTWFLIQKRIRRFRLLSELLQDAKEWVSKPWTHFYRGTKTNRHPDMPKRPLTGYMLFYMRNKDKLLAEFPGLEMTEVSKKMAIMYKDISSEKREKYMQLAASEKKIYEEKLEEFYRLHPEVPRISEKSNHSKPVDIGPKKPSTPFIIFYKEQLKNFHSDSEIDRNTFKEQCKEQWKTMSDKKKVVWIDVSLEQEEKYQEELKNYLIQNPTYVTTSFKTVVSKEEKSIKERLAGKPIKPPNSAYSLFSQMMLKSEEIKKIDPKGRMKALADHWKNCSEQEKKLYQEHCEQLMAQYKIDYATYIDSLPEGKRQEELQNNAPKRKIKKNEEVKSKTDEDKNKNEKKSKTEEKNKNEEKKETDTIHEVRTSKIDKIDDTEYGKDEANNDIDKSMEQHEELDQSQIEEGYLETKHKKEHKVKTPTKKRSKKKKKKRTLRDKSPNASYSNNGYVSMAKIFEAEPAQPPVSGFALFSKRYHGKAPVETAWKNLNNVDKKEYETEVQMLKQKYIKDYEIFLKSLSKEQLTAFSQMRKRDKKEKVKKRHKGSYSEDGEDSDYENIDTSE